MLTKFVPEGFLFIGDPHVSSRRPGRRIDDYAADVLEKLAACAEYCHEYKLIPVILGDLFHTAGENDLALLTRLIQVLKQFPVVPWCVGGNHDKERRALGEADALYLVQLAGAVRVIDGPEVQLAETVEFANGENASLYMCPYGAPLPDALPQANARVQIMVTHHDLAFGGAYPGAKPLREVKHCQMVVNGHMHNTLLSATCGETRLHNPGNIEPLSVDLIDHVPCAWAWISAEGSVELNALELPHNRNVFDLTGRQVLQADATDAVTAITTVPEGNSHFVELLLNESEMNSTRTDDASILSEDLEAVLEETCASDATALFLRSLIGQLELDSK